MNKPPSVLREIENISESTEHFDFKSCSISTVFLSHA